MIQLLQRLQSLGCHTYSQEEGRRPSSTFLLIECIAFLPFLFLTPTAHLDLSETHALFPRVVLFLHLLNSKQLALVAALRQKHGPISSVSKLLAYIIPIHVGSDSWGKGGRGGGVQTEGEGAGGGR